MVKVTKTKFVFWALVAFLLVGLLLIPVLFRAPVYYRTLRIDTRQFHAELTDPFKERDQNHPPTSEYYSTFRFMAHLGIYHYDGRKNLPYQVRLNAFDADLDKRVVSRSKFQELFRGMFGTVYGMTDYFYGSPKGTNSLRGSKFAVKLYRNNAEHEPPQVVANLPDPSP